MSKKKKRRIRSLALCVFRRGAMIFVAEGYDTHKDETFYRPIGGGIKFGERSTATIQREVMEEIGAEATDLCYLATLENIFTYEGKPGHEICLMYDGRFVDEARNQNEYTVQGIDDGELLFTGMWKPLDFFRNGNAPLYPDGLLELLDSDSIS